MKHYYDYDILLNFQDLIDKGVEWPEAEFQTREKFNIDDTGWQDFLILYDETD